MKARGEIFNVLSGPPPRPLKPIIKGPAFVKSVAYLVAALATIAVGLLDLWYYLFAHYKEPLFGNEPLILSYIVFIYSIGGFILLWSLSFMNIYSIYLFRKGRLRVAEVEKTYVQEKGGRKVCVVNWIVEDEGRISKGAVSVPISDIDSFRQDVGRGDVVYLLSSGKDPGDAMPVGIMGLRRDWSLLPSLAPPFRFTALRWGAVFWVLLCASVAVPGFMSSHIIEEAVPHKFIAVSALCAAAAAAVFWLLGRELRDLFRPSWYLWTAAVFTATYFMVFAGIKGANVWLDEESVRSRRVEVMRLDDALFPAMHRHAYVRSWREGRIKEKIPISWRMGLVLSPGDTIFLTIVDGRLGMPAVTAVRK